MIGHRSRRGRLLRQRIVARLQARSGNISGRQGGRNRRNRNLVTFARDFQRRHRYPCFIDLFGSHTHGTVLAYPLVVKLLVLVVKAMAELLDIFVAAFLHPVRGCPLLRQTRGSTAAVFPAQYRQVVENRRMLLWLRRFVLTRRLILSGGILVFGHVAFPGLRHMATDTKKNGRPAIDGQKL